MSEPSANAYCEYPDAVKERFSFGANHPLRHQFYESLNKRVVEQGFELFNLKDLITVHDEQVEPKDSPQEQFEYLGLEDIESDTGRIAFKPLQGKQIFSKAKVIQNGNIVFAGLRPYLNKVGIAEQDGIGSTELFVFEAKPDMVEPEYLVRYLLSDLTLTQTRWILTGSNYPRLNPEDFGNLLVIRPDKTRREAILLHAKALEKEADEGEKILRLAKDNFRNLILSALGITMPQPVNYDYYAVRPDHETFRLDYIWQGPWADRIRDLLDRVRTSSLGDIVESEVDYGANESGLEEGAVPFINIENIRADGRIDVRGMRFVNDPAPEDIAHEGDLLISRSRLVGNCAVVRKQEDGYCFGSYILRMRLQKGSPLPPEYLVCFLNSELGQAQVRILESGGFGKNINTRQLKEVRVPLPSADSMVPELAGRVVQAWDDIDRKQANAESLRTAARNELPRLLVGPTN